jgi:cytochrome P450 family 4
MFFVIAVICIFIGWYYHINREKLALASKLPSPKGYPLIGHAHKFLFKSPPQILQMLEGVARDHPNITNLMIGPNIEILITNPKYVEALLGSQKLIEKSAEYDFIEKWLGTGLLISTGKKWFQRRKVITPAFHFKILDQFAEIFDKHGTVLIECLSKDKGRPIDVFQPVTLCALDIICGEIN